MNNTYILLMAGGLGSRFWPKSRESYPKQFIDILGTGESLLQQTSHRFKGLCEMDHVFVLTNEKYQDLVQKQLPEIPPQNILIEPSRNNTAPCIAYACYKIYSLNPNANIVVSPSDQLILKEEEFKLRILQAINFASTNNALLTLGISPTRPDTGYGYIHYEANEEGVCRVNQFLEKPILEKAKMYVESGNYLWNAGIFIWNIKSIIEALETHANDVALIFKEGLTYYGTSAENEYIQKRYPSSPNISIDYAIMEKANNVYTIPADIGWSDLGTWASLYDVMPKDELNNAANIDKNMMIEANNCIVHLPNNKAAIIKGLNDYIIVDDGSVLLIYPKKEEQSIKELGKLMIEKYGKEYC
jgi:mannose-1-phosphate guanylyltransferase